MSYNSIKNRAREAKRRAWDDEYARLNDERNAARREHEDRYSDVAGKLEALGINPSELRDYLAGLE